MKIALWITSGTLLLSVAALLAVIGYTNLGRSLGQHWSSLDGPEPVWPAVIGFGSMNLIVVSGSVLVILGIVQLIRGARSKRPSA